MQPAEIFKTNVNNKETAEEVLVFLSAVFPSYQINFDLDDCDKVLRVVGNGILVDKVLQTMNQMGYDCELIN